MIDTIKQYLINFDKEIQTFDDFCHVFNLSLEEGSQALEEACKDDKVNHIVYVKKEYYTKEGKIDRSFAPWRNKDSVMKIISIQNRYDCSKNEKYNIKLNNLLEGEVVYKGAVDESDCGGIYTSCHTIYGDYGFRMKDFSSEPLSFIFDYFPFLKLDIKMSKEKNELTIVSEGIEVEGESPFLSIAEAIEKISKKKNFYIVQIFYVDPEDGEVEERPCHKSSLLFSEEDCKQFIRDNEYQYENCKFVIIKTQDVKNNF